MRGAGVGDGAGEAVGEAAGGGVGVGVCANDASGRLDAANPATQVQAMSSRTSGDQDQSSLLT